MEEREVVVTELEGMRERAAALIRAKLEAVAQAVREAATRTAGDLDLVVPPDLDAWLPLGQVTRRLDAIAKPETPAPIGLEVLRRLDSGRAQSEVLQELLRQLEPWCGPCAILVFRDGAVTGWAGAGFAATDAVRTWRGAVAESPLLSRVAEGHPAIARSGAEPLVGGWLPGLDARALAVPMSLRGKIVGALLAVEGDGRFVPEMVQLLTYLTGILLETLTVRPVVPTPALLDAEELAPTLAAARAVAAPMEEIAFADAAEAPVVAERPTPTPIDARAVDASQTVQLKVPVMPIAPPPVAPAVPVPPVIAPARSAEEERKHEEAKRFARLLVSEIRLYNEQAVQDGKVSRDIYRRLKEDIDRSREMYEQRVPSEVRTNSNYFFEELVRILANGDPDALGL